jgi:hypothetical protein
MNRFVHCTLGHFLQKPMDDEGGDLPGGEQQEEQQEEEEQEESEEEGEDEHVVVSIAGEKAPEEEEEQAAAPTWVKELRKQHREAQKELRELRAQVNKPAAVTAAPVLGKKPSMEDEDIDYDTEKFEAKLTAWHDRKREIEQHQRQQEEESNKQKTAWEAKLANYASSKTALKAKDYDDAEEVVRSEMDQTQQGIIIQVSKDPALMTYALGKNPKKAKELAAIKDYATFAFALGELSKDLKVEKKRSAPPPEKTITGTGRVSGGGDAHLERLRAEADKTGDRTKVVAYMREQKRKANG